jgi:DNA-directed RNA polymerase subunit omega
MRYPALNNLIEKTNNKYSLVLATAKRAREIVDGDEPLVKIKIDNPVTIATNEIAEEMVHCVPKNQDSEIELIKEDGSSEEIVDTVEKENESLIIE